MGAGKPERSPEGWPQAAAEPGTTRRLLRCGLLPPETPVSPASSCLAPGHRGTSASWMFPEPRVPEKGQAGPCRGEATLDHGRGAGSQAQWSSPPPATARTNLQVEATWGHAGDGRETQAQKGHVASLEEAAQRRQGRDGPRGLETRSPGPPGASSLLPPASGFQGPDGERASIWHPKPAVQLSHSVVSDSLRPHEPQHTRLPCPSPTPRAYSNQRPSSW